MAKLTNSILSTIDNPFDPFTDFTNWYNFDNDSGYNSCGILARLYDNSDDLPPTVEARLVEDAIDSFIATDPTGMYCKVQKEVEYDDYDSFVDDNDD